MEYNVAMGDSKIPRELLKPGMGNAFLRTLSDWYETPFQKNWSVKKKSSYHWRWGIAHVFFTRIGPGYHQMLTKLTSYYPFSLLFQDRLFHANNTAARNLMREMEKLSSSIGLRVYINTGSFDRSLSRFEGKFERGGINKQKAVKQMQKLFQDKIGNVYVHEEKIGFRILFDSSLLE